MSPTLTGAHAHTTVSAPCALFISDLHLQVAQPAITAAFHDFLARHARHVPQLYLLGDLFEYWVGDDDLDDPFNRDIIDALRRVSDAGTAIYWMGGNRDFLVGAGFAAAAGLTLLPEVHVTEIGGQRLVLVHGDAQCTEDVKYMAFRAMVRQPAYQQQFLAMPLAQRKAIVAGMRENSRTDQGEKSEQIMDVTPQAIADLFAQTDTRIMIHGHTHRPALHTVGATRRYVLPDWEPAATPPRGGWIAIDGAGAITRHGLDGAVIPSRDLEKP
ncbi:UDP-2,3-diacylglucosamine hydrolase [Duganella sp. Leaf126]|uniref:UDP-2,3-diacylglucosamine diphosphatase n=1 Tax=Duganella sp. Leaf126 TaxID=1736266 RepID=UPI0006FCD232|nr:UDP-2,3-diacylglucosamine diphosphatase [Duganella sp. Leaf126]KQQ45906.1 UDP-2,3-diacylglucosamine hydrolase [Duganella sp. Leaf126]